MKGSEIRNLVLVFGDQLDADGAAFDGLDLECDAVLTSEVLLLPLEEIFSAPAVCGRLKRR